MKMLHDIICPSSNDKIVVTKVMLISHNTLNMRTITLQVINNTKLIGLFLCGVMRKTYNNFELVSKQLKGLGKHVHKILL